MHRIAGLIVLLIFSLSSTAAENSPQAVVQQATGRLIEQLAASPEIINNTENLHQIIEKILLPDIDFTGLSKLVLGKYWQRANELQKQRFEHEFRILLIRTYAAILSKYTDQRIEYLPYKPDKKVGRATVNTRIIGAENPAVAVSYRLRQIDGGWKIYDMSIEGVSLALNYRSTFASEIEAKGIDGLIKSLADKNSDGKNAPLGNKIKR